MYSLIKFLKKVKDFRRGQGKRHPLWLIILIVILGLMTRHLGYRSLGNFAKFNQESLTKYLGIVSGEVPSYSTIRRAMMGIDCADLIEIFNQWASQLVRDNELNDWLAIDGKSLRSTVEYYRQHRQNFVSIVSVFARENKLVLSLEKLENKQTSEIHCVQGIVRNLPFTGQVLTLDALHCQKETIEAIVASKNDYVVAVKKNQPHLYKTFESLAQTSTPSYQDITLDKSHGRQIKRKVLVFPFPEELKSTWKKGQCFVQVERSGLRGAEPYYHRVYYLSSCQEDASVFREGIQGHWGIENQLHWPKDVILQEDLSTVHQFQPATNFSVLKTIGMNLFRFLGFFSITEGQRWLGHRFWRLVALL